MSLLSCQAQPVAPISEPLSNPNVKLTKLTEGFNFSVKMTLLPDGSFLVTEKNTGFVRRVSPTRKKYIARFEQGPSLFERLNVVNRSWLSTYSRQTISALQIIRFKEMAI
jgi:glucose/arabinose dehydrogenase